MMDAVKKEITDDSARDVGATDIGTDSGMHARDSEDMGGGGGTKVMFSSDTLRDVEGSADNGVFSEGTSGASGVAPSLAYTVVLFAILGCVCWCLGGAKGYGSLDFEDNMVVTMSSGVQRGLLVVSIFPFCLPYLFTYSCSYPFTVIMCCFVTLVYRLFCVE